MSVQSNLKSFLKAKQLQNEGKDDHGTTKESDISPSCCTKDGNCMRGSRGGRGGPDPP